MEFKVISLKTTTLHSGVVEKNKFISIMKNGYKGMATFIHIHKYAFLQVLIYIHSINITKKNLFVLFFFIYFNHFFNIFS